MQYYDDAPTTITSGGTSWTLLGGYFTPAASGPQTYQPGGLFQLGGTPPPAALPQTTLAWAQLEALRPVMPSPDVPLPRGRAMRLAGVPEAGR